ncbi:hypothetical protein ACLOJK_006877, partial [Asimina triloba]
GRQASSKRTWAGGTSNGTNRNQGKQQSEIRSVMHKPWATQLQKFLSRKYAKASFVPHSEFQL